MNHKQLFNTFDKRKLYIEYCKVLDYCVNQDVLIKTKDCLWHNVYDDILEFFLSNFGVKSEFKIVAPPGLGNKVCLEFDLIDEDYLPKQLLKHKFYTILSGG